MHTSRDYYKINFGGFMNKIRKKNKSTEKALVINNSNKLVLGNGKMANH